MEITVKDAVRIVCEKWPVGVKKRGYEICEEVTRELQENGSIKRPMQSTILRRLREVDDSYGVHAVTKWCTASEYIKSDRKEWISQVIKERA
jgi:hypothetical protein